jgi:putative cell wall-binding protein
MRARAGIKGVVAASLVVAMAAVSLPAWADDDSEAQADGLEVEVRPAIATPSGVVTIAAEFELDDDDEEPEESDDDETDDEETAEESDDADETDQTDGEETAEESQDERETTTDTPAPVETDAPEGPVVASSGDGTDTSDAPSDMPADAPTDAAPEETDEREDAAPAPVTFSVDFGDGPEPMRLTARDGDEAKAIAQHQYAEEGTYTVRVTATPSGATPVSVEVKVEVGGGAARLGGRDRHETANRLSREDFPTDGEAGAVLLARSDTFADALAAASVAVLEDAPVLLTPTADVPPSVLEEIARALGDSGTVYLLGGESAVAPSVAEALVAAGYDVVRMAGSDRIATSLQLAQFLLDAGVDVDEVVLASSTNFPDALAGAAYAGGAEAAVLLTPSDALDPRVRQFLADLGPDVEVHVAGGAAAVSDAVLAEVAALGGEVKRLSGEDRYETAVEIAEALFPAPAAVALATGRTFPDALAGAAAAGRRDAPVLLVGDTLPESVRAYLEQHVGSIEAVYVLGGESVVAPALMAEVQQILGL